MNTLLEREISFLFVAEVCFYRWQKGEENVRPNYCGENSNDFYDPIQNCTCIQKSASPVWNNQCSIRSFQHVNR
jgi:hypothetical protein